MLARRSAVLQFVVMFVAHLSCPQITRAQDQLVLFKLERWEPRGLAESTRTHIYVDEEAIVRLLGEGGPLKGGKRWGQPAELVRITLVTSNGEQSGKLTWLGPQHTFGAEQGMGIAFGRGDIGTSSLPGGEHILHGSGTIFGHKFVSTESYPLTFKLVSGKGYVYMCGKGSVTSSSGKQYTLGTNDTVATYLKLINDKEQLNRERAAQALGYLTRAGDTHASEVTQALSEALLHDPAMEVRRNSAQALGRIGDMSVLDALKQGKKDAHEWVRIVAEEAIANLSQPRK